MARTAAEGLIEQGKEIGIEEGAVGAKREDVLKLLAHRFGSVPQPLATHVTQLHHIAQLDALFDTVMEAESLEQKALRIFKYRRVYPLENL